ncbi:hypothetical protein LCGC14_0822550 [marine sediment metagenome]|uniref:Gamma-glutamyltransferase n=1 Tax=marine sediment metagenome TaxID=412755 RepID=A0A0F9SQX7_9ZZZZ|nr:gamma-glutamyltransferase [Candidatus Aminicenantes bacterium]HEB34945.1 gamma-glutamyltransferase [Candidatus Aminicenantes bacterium]
MRYDRRTFFRKTLVGASAPGACYLGLLKSNTLGKPVQLQGPGITTDEERKKLIYEAHFGRKTPAASKRGMVICSHPLATREAMKVLKRGGNACDASLCAAITQAVIEPHMSGITGMFDMLYYHAASAKSTYVNANWNTPLEPLPNITPADISTGRAQGVPGWWAGFEEAHKRYGSKSIKEIMEPAIRYARDGFEVHPFLWGAIFAQIHRIGMTEEGREIFMPQNVLSRPWEKLYQKRQADTLERLSEEGSDFYYRGEFAEDFCKVIQEAGGAITRKDMEAYQALWMEPQWETYREYNVATASTPLVKALKRVEQLDLEKLGPPTDSSETLYQMVRITTALYGTWLHPGTCHISAIDEDGNIAGLMHSSNASAWGNGLFVRGASICAGGGFLLSKPKPKPGQRGDLWRSPSNIIFKDKKPVLVSGSPSLSLLHNIIQNTTNILDFDIPIEESVNRPRFGGWSPTIQGANIIEADLSERVRKKAEEKGLRFDVVNPWNVYHGAFEGIYIEPETGLMRARGDPRRCSKAEGL